MHITFYLTGNSFGVSIDYPSECISKKKPLPIFNVAGVGIKKKTLE